MHFEIYMSDHLHPMQQLRRIVLRFTEDWKHFDIALKLATILKEVLGQLSHGDRSQVFAIFKDWCTNCGHTKEECWCRVDAPDDPNLW